MTHAEHEDGLRSLLGFERWATLRFMGLRLAQLNGNVEGSSVAAAASASLSAPAPTEVAAATLAAAPPL